MEFQVKFHTYRIKKMNAIELLALRSLVNFKSVESVMNCYNNFLERIEVQIKDKWLPVKQGNLYLPNGIEDDFETIEALISKMLEYVKDVFQKSNASNN